MRELILAASVAVMAALPLAACDRATDTDADAAASTAASTTADATSAEAFVRSLYADDGASDGERIETSDIWSARTRALLAETDRLTVEGDQGFFDAEPICDCQDGTPALQSATVSMTGPESADVAVAQGFVEPGNETHRKTYRLVREGGQWRIDDMTYQDMGEFEWDPLVRRLNTWITEAKATPAA